MPRKRKEADLVYFEDTGTIYGAPIDVLWDFILKANEPHSKAHQHTLRNMNWRVLNEITGEGSCEVVRGGKWRRMRFRIATIPPLVRIIEEFGGRYDGQKMVFLYTPKGRRTAVDVFVRTRKEVVEETRQALANAYEEDLPALRDYLRSRGGAP